MLIPLLLLAFFGTRAHSLNCLQNRYSEQGTEIEKLVGQSLADNGLTDCASFIKDVSHCVLINNTQTKELYTGCSQKGFGYCDFYKFDDHFKAHKEDVLCTMHYISKKKPKIADGKQICCCRPGKEKDGCFKRMKTESETYLALKAYSNKESIQVKFDDKDLKSKKIFTTPKPSTTTKGVSRRAGSGGVLLILAWSGAVLRRLV